MHALVIDDDRSNLEILGKLLASHNVTSSLIQDVNQIEAVLKALTEVNLVFLDLEMPLADGYQIFRYLREEMGVDAPIIACTVHINEINVARQLGFHSFLGKPLRSTTFADQLRRILDNVPVWEIK